MNTKNTLTVLLSVIILLGVFGFVVSATGSSDSSGKTILTIRILDFESPAKLGDFLNFKYYLRDVSGINNNAAVNFNIEKDGKTISSGSDTVYLSDVQNKTFNTKVFLPSSIKSGIYNLNIEINYQGYAAKSYRTFEIVV
jgi:hypothetical protein